MSIRPNPPRGPREPRGSGATSAAEHVAHALGLGDELVVQALVAEGAHASVYEVQYRGAPAALKVYAARFAEATLASARVEREIEAQRALRHPCIARLVDAGRATDGRPYLISEWVEGPTLEARLGEGPLTWMALRPIAVSIARGLRAIHAAGIIHRDVKPSNVVLPANGEPAAKLLDFGHALMLDESRLTESGWALGSASYMSPEQASGANIDARSDLYALGVVLYRALTGTLPFDDPSPAAVLDLHRHAPVIPPRSRAPELDIDPSADDLVMWLLTKPAEARVPNAAVLLHTMRAE